MLAKYTGSQWAYYARAPVVFNPDDAATVTARAKSGGYVMANFSAGYSAQFPGRFVRRVKIQCGIDNLFNRDVKVIDSYNSSGVQLHAVLPTRNYFVRVSGEF